MPTNKLCYQCGNDNPDQAFCGNCGSPLALNDYISRQVKDQLAGTIQNGIVYFTNPVLKTKYFSIYTAVREIDNGMTGRAMLTIYGIGFRGEFLYISHMEFFRCFLKDEQGQDLIEYTLLMAFIALASAAVFVNAGQSISTIWGSASTQLSNAALSAS